MKNIKLIPITITINDHWKIFTKEVPRRCAIGWRQRGGVRGVASEGWRQRVDKGLRPPLPSGEKSEFYEQYLPNASFYEFITQPPCWGT